MTKKYKNRAERNKVVRAAIHRKRKEAVIAARRQKQAILLGRLRAHTDALKEHSPELYGKFMQVLRDHPHVIMEDGSIHFKENINAFEAGDFNLFTQLNETLPNPNHILYSADPEEAANDSAKPAGNTIVFDEMGHFTPQILDEVYHSLSAKEDGVTLWSATEPADILKHMREATEAMRPDIETMEQLQTELDRAMAIHLGVDPDTKFTRVMAPFKSEEIPVNETIKHADVTERVQPAAAKPDKRNGKPTNDAAPAEKLERDISERVEGAEAHDSAEQDRTND